VAWARAAAADTPHPRAVDLSKGLQVRLDERRSARWSKAPDSGQPVRSVPRLVATEIETCARCHARRSTLHEDNAHGQPVADDYRVALLDAELYYPDGQVRAEVYEYGSFIQSKMHAAGVTCSDCHEPHSAQLRAPGNALCVQCHDSEHYATERHHFHAQGSEAANCVSCHMPATTFMGVDARRDHSLRVPRPDQSVSLGVPNPCNACHSDRPASWAARTLQNWYGHTPAGHQQFALALAQPSNATPVASQLLSALISDRTQPAIARASALARLVPPLARPLWEPIHDALSDPSPLVRRSAARFMTSVEPRLRSALLAPLLLDPVRAVRLETAAALADITPGQIEPARRGALQAAFAEYTAAQMLNGDRPEGQLSLALLYTGQQQFDRAEQALKRALTLDPAFAPAAVNLADLYRAQGRDQEAELMLRNTLDVGRPLRQEPSLLHALGLTLVRQRRLSEATSLLGEAARSAPHNARYDYVYAAALGGLGNRNDAVRVLEGTLERHPYDRDALSAMIAFQRQAGQSSAALVYQARLSALAGLDEVQPAEARHTGHVE
jgi:predicted CXXCH cytochrome family protein